MVDTKALYPIAVLIDELKSEDQKKRYLIIDVMHYLIMTLELIQLRILARQLQLQGKRELEMNYFLTFQIIDYLNLDLMDDEEEVLLALADVLGNFLDYVGGPAHALHLVKSLEKLCQVEETTVRDKATEGIKRILSFVKIKDIETQVVDLVKRLMNGEGYTAKFSATQLIPTIYPNVSPQSQQDLMGKVAAIVLNEMIKLVPKTPEAELLNIFGRFFKDEQDSVRMQGIDSCVVFAKHLPVSKVNAYLLPYIKKFAEDKSWRIRYLVADRIMDLANGIGYDQAKEHLLPYYQGFLSDSESEVRTAAVSRLSDFCKIVDAQSTIAKIIPALKKLQTDQFQYVRSALAENVLAICPQIDKASTNEHILPIFLALLRDESSDVRLNLFKRLEDLNKVLGIENLSQSIIPALTELSQDKNWRIKLSVVEQFPILAKQLGEVFFNEKLSPICITWLSDNIFSIREAALNNLKQLTEIFGVTWATKYVVPQLLSLQVNSNYLHRLTPLFGIAQMSQVMPSEAIKKLFLPVLATLSQDQIPNIRMNVAKSIHSILPYAKGNVELEDKLKQMLRELAKDQDQDVKYYSARALAH
ncbi:serine threonine-protein phosphatase 2a 65 kda regulatory subunit a beta isoform-like [Stylonychia lemnae]|uniref:Serine threonine-protein phosphatase 2a 65 kDa regulatory subunit a beta isoform-like n=1 Tax=Stylonychia lemnae TaxID=5949 RepID=A0A078A718_STYLE|nr:serine threonine-protein phosphatase 2a 65 kda regulatory subunit a beta isoform-like [Stylonychia lemnae]|eukprot:CDW78034.1 serine threonine-protein phosphatase 2a 65 kda regulatory subunit a beta isoform-like [Stylonychia lemnae]